MFSRCPTCRTLYRLHHGVADSQGAILCARCGNIFDCLDTVEAGQSRIDSKALLEQTVQTFGDSTVVVHSNIPPAKPWFPAKSPPCNEAQDTHATAVEEQTARAPLSSYLLRGNLGLALRNLMRNRRRSLLALAAISFGVIAILLAGGFIGWILDSMRESQIQAQLGHFQIVKRDYFTRGAADPFAFLLPQTDPMLEEIERWPEVSVVAPRLYFSGLISRGDTTVSFVGQGVDPTKELILSKQVHIRTGDNIAADDSTGIIVGAGLAENLGAKIGEKLVLMVTTGDGGINAVDTHIRGIFYTATKAFDDAALRLDIRTARELVRAKGSHAWVVLLKDTEQFTRVLGDMQSRYAARDKDIEFVPWYKLADFYNKTVRLFSQQIRLVWLVIGLLILLSISNTLTMSVLERTSEIGTMMALGVRRDKVLRLFVSEGFVLGLTGGILGVALGWLLAVVISYVGIPMPPPPGMDVGFTAAITVTPALAFSGLAMAIIATTSAALYPAWKASRLEIVHALRHNR